MNLSAIKLLFVLLLTGASGAAQSEEEKFNPETVMLSHFTFVRPASWQWDEQKSGEKEKKPTEQDGVIREVVFRLNESTGHKTNSASAFFNLYPASSDLAALDTTVQRWRKWFKKTRSSDPVVTQGTIGSNKVSWVEIQGTYWTGRTNSTLYGAIIEDKEGNILARLDGAADAVENNKPAFKKMVEDALKQE